MMQKKRQLQTQGIAAVRIGTRFSKCSESDRGKIRLQAVAGRKFVSGHLLGSPSNHASKMTAALA
ncbi:MAG: hypothetical protein DMG79_02930 [Acidobacteria bacterium]|nr:MAG: hypothetical protein DMG79_02930 [Acidobacteriota bacterium]